MKLLSLLILLGLCVACYADTAARLDAWADRVALMQGALTALLGFAVDYVLRRFPTRNPMSLLWLICRILHAVAKFSEAVAKVMDDFLGQVRK